MNVAIDRPGLRLWNPSNTREHHMVRAKRNAAHKAAAWAAVKVALTASAKWIRDGVAYALGLDDADPRLLFVVDQERRKTYGVRIIIEGREP
jgi:hypothetical protein